MIIIQKSEYFLLIWASLLTDTLLYTLPMRNPLKENLFNTLNATNSYLNQKKDSQNGKLTHRDCESFIQQMLILKQSALLALAEKNDVIEHLTHKLQHSQLGQLQFSLEQKQQEKLAVDLLLTKIHEKNQQIENGKEQMEKQRKELERFREQIENLQWQKQSIIGQLQRYEAQNQSLRDMIQQLIAENHKIRQNQSFTLLQQQTVQKTSSIDNPSSCLTFKGKLQQQEQQRSRFCSDSKSKDSQPFNIQHSRSPSLKVLLLERSKSIAQFTNTNQQADMLDLAQNSLTGDIKQSTVNRHCLGLSLKAINLIETYSVNSLKKRMPDCDSQMTARYFQYFIQKDLDRRYDYNSVDELQAQSCEDIVEQAEERENDLEVQSGLSSCQQDKIVKWKWGALGVVIGAFVTFVFKK